MIWMIALSALFGLAAVALHGYVVISAFRDATPKGLLALFVPGYSLFYAYKRMGKPSLVIAGVVALAIAGALGAFATAFEPDAIEEIDEAESLFDDAFDDLDAPLN